MTNKKLFCTGCTGTVIAALCCFTPLLVIGLGAVGLSAWLGWIDYVLFPVLFASLGIVAYALYLRAGSSGPSPMVAIGAAVIAFSVLIVWLEFHYAIRISLVAVAVLAAVLGSWVGQAHRTSEAALADAQSRGDNSPLGRKPLPVVAGQYPASYFPNTEVLGAGEMRITQRRQEPAASRVVWSSQLLCSLVSSRGSGPGHSGVLCASFSKRGAVSAGSPGAGLTGLPGVVC